MTKSSQGYQELEGTMFRYRVQPKWFHPNPTRNKWIDEIRPWLIETFGQPGVYWNWKRFGVLEFIRAQDLVLFKLRWHDE